MFKECLSQSILPCVTFLIIKCEQKKKNLLKFEYFFYEIIFRILNFCIKQTPSLVDKRDLKDLQVYYRFFDSNILKFSLLL
jgi:hypothetical protein